MSRTARLLEILIVLRSKSRFTVAEMAEEFGVSRRTMLRDLHALSEMGAPLAATPGPGGGYRLIGDRRLLPLSLATNEAIAIILSYEGFLQYADSPFAASSLAAITKLRNALPPDIVRELDRIHERVVVLQPAPHYRAPLLAELLQAALDGAHLEIVYESLSRVGKRLIFPYGLYASQGFWYCACYDYRRQASVGLRADRITAMERKEGLSPAEAMTVRDWLADRGRDAGDCVAVRAQVTPRGAKRFQFAALFGTGAVGEDDVLTVELPRSELAWFADQLLALGTDVIVESPAELVAMIGRRATAITTAYRASRHSPGEAC